ncbi:hypothetical protein IV102_33565 [bacterium]|nr:hypothetical protein [bacterium]
MAQIGEVTIKERPGERDPKARVNPVGKAKGTAAGTSVGGGQPVGKKQDVFMPSAGVTQAVKVREAGSIKNGHLASGNIAVLKDKKR